MIDVMQLAAQIGGIGGLFAVLIFIIYRWDRRASEKRLTGLLEQDQKTREEHTKVLTELITYLKLKNGSK